MQHDNAYDLASHIATSTGLLKELYADKTPEGLSRYENVQELLNGIKEFVETGRTITPAGDEDAYDTGEVRTLEMFMQDISLLTDADDENKDGDTVSLMTIHSAKGLEFPAVFVVGLEENLFPSQLSVNSREDLEEERRLFYVAITRAEKKLTLSYANQRFRWGNLITCEPSRFLEEVDPKHIEHAGYRKAQYDYELDGPPQRGWSKTAPTVKNSVLSQRASNFKKYDPTQPEVIFVPDDTSGLQTGMEVEHERFGKGKVLLVEGNGVDRKAVVFFQGFGNKQLLLKFAKLKILA